MTHIVRRRNRVPPHDLEAEECVLAACLVSRDALADIIELVKPTDFYRPANQVIFATIAALFGRGDPVDAITVKDELVRAGKLAEVGGYHYLTTVIGAHSVDSAALRYAEIVIEHSTLRQLHAAAHRMEEIALSAPGDVAAAIEQAETAVFDVAARRVRGNEVQSLGELLDGTMSEIESRSLKELSGVPSGISRLDKMTGGFRGSQFVVVAARPSVGKSSLLTDFALAAGRSGEPAMLFTLEMSKGEVVERLIGTAASVSSTKLRTGELGPADWERISGALGALSLIPVFIDDTPNVTLMEMRAKARRQKSKTGLSLVLVDYLQLMTGPLDAENRQHAISEISRGLKLLARELGVPVIAASQLNRSVEYRADKRPVLSDLRDSGALEQDSDVVIQLYREEIYHPERTKDGRTELIVAKQRNGPTGTVVVFFDGEFTTFTKVERPREPSQAMLGGGS